MSLSGSSWSHGRTENVATLSLATALFPAGALFWKEKRK